MILLLIFLDPSVEMSQKLNSRVEKPERLGISFA